MKKRMLFSLILILGLSLGAARAQTYPTRFSIQNADAYSLYPPDFSIIITEGYSDGPVVWENDPWWNLPYLVPHEMTLDLEAGMYTIQGRNYNHDPYHYRWSFTVPETKVFGMEHDGIEWRVFYY